MQLGVENNVKQVSFAAGFEYYLLWIVNQSPRSEVSQMRCRSGEGPLNTEGQAMERPIGVDFVCDSVFDRETMEAAKSGSDVLPAFSASENSGSRVLDILKPEVRNHKWDTHYNSPDGRL